MFYVLGQRGTVFEQSRVQKTANQNSTRGVFSQLYGGWKLGFQKARGVKLVHLLWLSGVNLKWDWSGAPVGGEDKVLVKYLQFKLCRGGQLSNGGSGCLQRTPR